MVGLPAISEGLKLKSDGSILYSHTLAESNAACLQQTSHATFYGYFLFYLLLTTNGWSLLPELNTQVNCDPN